LIVRLPDPSPEEVVLSTQLVERIRNEIVQSGGFISFEHYMELVLYAPGLGYYVAGTQKFGRGGDFITAPEISPLFGGCLARQCADTLRVLKGGSIVEYGGGSGALAVSILNALQRADILPSRYAIVELSPELRQRQRARIEREAPTLLPLVEWWNSPPATPVSGVAIANEVLDALPALRFEQTSTDLCELGITLSANAQLQIDRRTAGSELREHFRLRCDATKATWALPYQSELNRRVMPWIASLTEFLQQGVVILADYGYARSEYYRADRTQGTLQCFYRHRVHDDPLWHPGLQDISVSVEFTAVAEAALAAGFDVRGYTEQAAYLLGMGLPELLGEFLPGSDEYFRAAQAAKTLILPQAMGARAKFMVLTYRYPEPVSGFSVRDDRYQL
jgi:SAM-dependent MidA family methyltransferase